MAKNSADESFCCIIRCRFTMVAPRATLNLLRPASWSYCGCGDTVPKSKGFVSYLVDDETISPAEDAEGRCD